MKKRSIKRRRLIKKRQLMKTSINEKNVNKKTSINKKSIPICVPRYLFQTIECTVTNVQLHGFCDASEQAYCAVIFVTTVKSENEIASRIVTSKTKVAPIKKHSIPRLELLSSLLLTELMQSLCTAIKDVISIKKNNFWSDSEVALSWIKGEGKQWKPWVQNRVQKIREMSDVDVWYHVCTELNPADIGIREAAALKFVNNDLWWYGPPYLKQKIETLDEVVLQAGDVVNERESVVVLVVDSAPVKVCGVGNFLQVERYGSLKKLLRVTAYIWRFLDLFLRKVKRTYEIGVDEIEKGLKLWIKYEQKIVMADKEFSNKNRQLNLFFDDEDILRLKGRLENSHLPNIQSSLIIEVTLHGLLTLMRMGR